MLICVCDKAHKNCEKYCSKWNFKKLPNKVFNHPKWPKKHESLNKESIE